MSINQMVEGIQLTMLKVKLKHQLAVLKMLQEDDVITTGEESTYTDKLKCAFCDDVTNKVTLLVDGKPDNSAPEYPVDTVIHINQP